MAEATIVALTNLATATATDRGVVATLTDSYPSQHIIMAWWITTKLLLLLQVAKS
jgi:hypothetical protein